ncbi:hypothetical protein F5Y16DRAFT_359652 [Xylariaceae sp. FL0255]|nr:hypothetical protein F5Y16DRAFT_359652 [Xylariaceae sp. FL0255]
MPGLVEPELVEESEPQPLAEPPVDLTPPRPYVVFKQHVELEIDFREKRIYGSSHILVVPIEHDVQEVYIDARQCNIDTHNITVSNCPAKAFYEDPCDKLSTPTNYEWSAAQWSVRKQRIQSLLHHRRKEVPAMAHDLACCQPLDGALRVVLPSAEDVKRKNKDAPKADQQELLIHADGNVQGYRISIPFELKNVENGLHFVGVDEDDSRYPHVYTRHSIEPGTACSIFPCIDDPSCRNPWKISITCPRTLGDAFDQPLATQQHLNTVAANGNLNQKPGDQEPKKPLPRRDYGLTEEDKLLEMTVVCSGFLTGEVMKKEDESKKTMTFEVDKNKAAKHIGFAVGPFEHVDLWSEFRSEEDDIKLGVSAAKVHGYCLPGRAEEVRNTCAALVTAVDSFVLHFGRYPFENYKVCFVDDMVESSIPLCAFSLCSSKLLFPEGIIETEVETTRTLVYSLASQWFGVNIIPNARQDIWLVVGIAWYMTEYFMRALCGNNAFRFRMKTMADRLVEIDFKRPSLQDIGEHLYLGDFEVDFMNLKAPLVLFILDRRLSKSSGSAGISRIVSRMVSKANTSTQANDDVLPSDSFRKACEKIGSTRLESFWNQWIVGSGCPRFDVFQRFNKKKLCVEMTVSQMQDMAAEKPRPIDKSDFWKDVREETHGVYAGELQKVFTGPMTIRIHEADGTPYEHIVEIREDSSRSVKFEIPYNTKYKRLKRNRRNRERQIERNNAKDEDQREPLYYLGDVMQNAAPEEWGFRDWDLETEAKMDQESYEWIRMDADFEWICEMKTNLPSYMYVSQLQQDRDVAAQQDSMLFLQQSFAKSGAHPLISTFLTRTLLDIRYFYGLRLIAADELPRHAVPGQVDWIGLKHLQKTFQYFFCYPGTHTPRPNNFADRRQYMVQCVIPEAIARVRGDDGKCPKEARRFILELLKNNNNSENVYSDEAYLCRLLKALATCLVPDESKAKSRMDMSLSFGDGDEDEDMMDDDVDPEPEEFRELALDEIERYRRRDEYSPSFQNCFTVAALEALCILMKAKVIETTPVTFVQYLQDRTCDIVRIKACESLVEIGMLDRPEFLRFFFSLISTDPSPYVRDRLFKALCRGLASMAIGETPDPRASQPHPAKDGLDLVLETDGIVESRQKAKARKENLQAALAGLKERTEDDEALLGAVWKALESPLLTVAERINLLEVCALLVDEEPSLTLNIKYPSYWTTERVERVRDRKYALKFKKHYRTKSRGTYATPVAPPKPEPKRTITLNVHRNPSFSSKPPTAATPSQTLPPTTQVATPPPQKKSISVTVPRPSAPKPTVTLSEPIVATPLPLTPASALPKSALEKEKSVAPEPPRKDSIAVLPPIRPTIEPQQPAISKSSKVNGSELVVKPSKSLKRASTDSDSGRPSKIVKLNTSRIVEAIRRLQPLQPAKKLVTVKFTAFDRLRMRADSPASVTIRATPKQPTTASKKPIAGLNNDSNSRVIATPRAPSTTTTTKPASKATSPSKPPSSQPRASTPTSTPATTVPNLPSSGSSGGKPRKPLPDGRKPLPSSAPTPSKPSSFSASSPAPAATSTAAPGKIKFKLKPTS